MKQTNMFDNGADLPLFSGTPQRAQDSTFTAQEQPKQLSMTSCPICKDTGTVGTYECALWEKPKQIKCICNQKEDK